GVAEDQELCGKASHGAQFRRGRGNLALAVRGAVLEARAAGLGRVCPAHLARAPRSPRARPRSEAGADVARSQSGTTPPDAMGPVRRTGARPAHGHPWPQFGYAVLDDSERDAGAA